MEMNNVFIIAEAGVNHNGDVNLAMKLIEAAKETGADCVKFQTWITEELMTEDAIKADYQIKNDGSSSQFEMAKRLELSYENFALLKQHAEKVGILFLSTPDEVKSLNFLVDELNLPLIKVGSGEINNILFLKQIAKKKLPVILSTGMSFLADVEKAYYTLIENGAQNVSLLHCTSEYPAPYDSVNLKAMQTLQQVFQTTIGYSDHTQGIEISIAAVALGARIIEKHFTLDKSLPGPDHKASLDPVEFKQMVKCIRNVEKAIGNGIKKPNASELATKKIVGKGLYTKHKMTKGTVITENDLVGKRPETDLSIADANLIIGKKIKNDLNKGEPFLLREIEF